MGETSTRPGASSAQAEALVEAESLGADAAGLADPSRVGARIGRSAMSRLPVAGPTRSTTLSGVGPARPGSISPLATEIRALVSLRPAVPRCVRHEVVLALLRSRAVADRDDAMKYASTAVEIALASACCRPWPRKIRRSSNCVEQAAWRAPPEWLDRLRRSTAVAWTGRASGGPTLVEPLTERERDVLRFLPSRLTVREIADELFVSVNTVKFHLRVIYRKLGVTSRAEAADVARRMTKLRR